MTHRILLFDSPLWTIDTKNFNLVLPTLTLSSSNCLRVSHHVASFPLLRSLPQCSQSLSDRIRSIDPAKDDAVMSKENDEFGEEEEERERQENDEFGEEEEEKEHIRFMKVKFNSPPSLRGTAVTMKNMLEIAFPGTEVIHANYPPPLPKRLLSKVVPVVQIGVIGVVIAGERIFPMLGFVAPRPWYYNLRSNRFGTIASAWLLGNALQSFLHSSGAFEVYFNGKLMFSKLKEPRFPGEVELKDLISKKMANSRLVRSVPEMTL